MKLFTALYTVSAIALLSTSCFDESNFQNTKSDNFDALWTILDQHYCFFDYKNVDWDAVYDNYALRIDEQMGQTAFFKVLCEMLSELQDGHVNLIAAHDVGRYWAWKEDYDHNFDTEMLYSPQYLGNDYMIAAGMDYKILDDNIGLIRYDSFSSAIGDGNITQVIAYLSLCKAIIVDVRNNGGGNLSNVDLLVARFINERILAGYMLYKTGKGHNDFSEPIAKYIENYPGLRYQKPVYLLTNRACYSATNEFVNAMKVAGAIVVGDKTGGGAGLPFSSELPNGWSVRYSGSPMLNPQMEQIEFGIEPDVWAVFTDSDPIWKTCDPVIEKARELINAN